MLVQSQGLLILLLIVSICGLLDQVYGSLLGNAKVGEKGYGEWEVVPHSIALYPGHMGSPPTRLRISADITTHVTAHDTTTRKVNCFSHACMQGDLLV